MPWGRAEKEALLGDLVAALHAIHPTKIISHVTDERTNSQAVTDLLEDKIINSELPGNIANHPREYFWKLGLVMNDSESDDVPETPRRIYLHHSTKWVKFTTDETFRQPRRISLRIACQRRSSHQPHHTCGYRLSSLLQQRKTPRRAVVLTENLDTRTDAALQAAREYRTTLHHVAHGGFC
jgi:hypothetical protein